MNPIFGILLALACALTTNVGFLFKHRGACAAPAVDFRHPLRTGKSLFSSRLFALGMLIAATAWVFHVAALAVAPLSLVQAVLAGGVVLLAVMAERSFGLQISRRQWTGIVLTAVGLLILGFSLPAVHGAHSRFSVPGMICFEFGLLAVGTLLIMGPRIGAPAHHRASCSAPPRASCSASRMSRSRQCPESSGSHGLAGLVTPWLLVAIVASVAAFYSSAKGLQEGDAVPVIAVTGTAANVAGIVGGILVFGDPLPGHPLMLVAEMLAFALVLVAAWLTPAPIRAADSAGAPALA